MMSHEDNQGSNNKLNEEKAFEIHKRDSHNIYDYIFFLAYLQEKPELEYTGLESFVFEKFSDLNNTWFPIYKVGSDKQKDNMISHHDEDKEENDGSQSDSESDNDPPRDDDKGKIGNKHIIECLRNMNDKIDFMSESLGILQGQEEEDAVMTNKY